MQTLNLKHFKASHLMRLNNQEFLVIYDEILEVFKGEEITVEYVTKALEGVSSETNKLVVLRDMNRKHHLTESIEAKKLLRFDYFSVFTSSVRTALKSPFEANREAAEVLNKWLEPYKRSLHTPLLAKQTSIVKLMTDEIENLSRLSEAITTLSMLELWQTINAVNTEIRASMTLRTKERAAERREAREVRRAAYAKMMVFLNSIEMVLNLNDGNTDVYMRYAKEVNEILDYYRALVMSRSTRLKTAAEKAAVSKEDEVDSNMGDTTEGSNEPAVNTPKSTATTTYNNPYALMVLGEDVAETGENLNATADANGETMSNGKSTDYVEEALLANGDSTAHFVANGANQDVLNE